MRGLPICNNDSSGQGGEWGVNSLHMRKANLKDMYSLPLGLSDLQSGLLLCPILLFIHPKTNSEPLHLLGAPLSTSKNESNAIGDSVFSTGVSSSPSASG